MASKNDLQQLVGQLFCVGFKGFSVPPEFKKFVQEYNLGGTIYFKHNVQSPTQLAELSNELQFNCRSKTSPFLTIAIDHEGGLVNRLVPPFTKFPSADFLGQLGSPKVGFKFGSVIGRELKAVGINVNFAPVVDVNTRPDNPAMNTRMYSSDPEMVAKLASAVCRGLQKMGVAAVAKHFPGHGDTKVDSHFELPRVDKTLDQLEACELIPFRKVIRSRVEGVMTSHIVNQNLDPDYPATLSEKTINDLLREKLRFSKVIFTDDMEMKAITDHFGAEESAILAVNAGVDGIIYRGDNGLPIAQIEAIVKAIESKRIPKVRVELAVSRLAALKQTYATLNGPVSVSDVAKNVGLPEHLELAGCIERKELPPEEEGDENAF